MESDTSSHSEYAGDKSTAGGYSSSLWEGELWPAASTSTALETRTKRRPQLVRAVSTDSRGSETEASGSELLDQDMDISGRFWRLVGVGCLKTRPGSRDSLSENRPGPRHVASEIRPVPTRKGSSSSLKEMGVEKEKNMKAEARRVGRLCESFVLSCALGLALYQLYQVYCTVCQRPELVRDALFLKCVLWGYLFASLAMPSIAYWRPTTVYLRFPFTDIHEYRLPELSDDGYAVGCLVPFLALVGKLALVHKDFLLYEKDTGAPGFDAFGGLSLLVGKWKEQWSSGESHWATPTRGIMFQAQFKGLVQMLAVQATLVLTTCVAVGAWYILFHDTGRVLLAEARQHRIYRIPKRLLGAFIFVSIPSAVLVFILGRILLPARELSFIRGETIFFALVYPLHYIYVLHICHRTFTLGELVLLENLFTFLYVELVHTSRAWIMQVLPVQTRLASYANTMQVVTTFLMIILVFTLSPLFMMSRRLAQPPRVRVRGRRTARRSNIRFLVSFILTLVIAIFLFGPVSLWAGAQMGGNLLTPWLWLLSFSLGYTHTDGSMDALVRTCKYVFRVDDSALASGDFAQLTLPAWGSRLVQLVASMLPEIYRLPPMPHISLRMFLAAYWLAGIATCIVFWHLHLASTHGSGEVQSLYDLSGPRASWRRHVPGVSPLALNSRRKSFHLLAVLLFAPGIIFEPVFMFMAFTFAFVIFLFAELARYFALYPVGAMLHVFFMQFVDSKDGPVVVSHFYLLGGCAMATWLELPSPLARLSGVLAIGIGDSAASIVGKRYGRIQWFHSKKTIEGTIAFVVSILIFVLGLRCIGAIEAFSLHKFVLASTLTALLEAFTTQNDNIVVPIFYAAAVCLLRV